MITRLDLDQRVREWGLRDDVVEKDYVLGWLLWGIGSDEDLSGGWIFKGGTCLKKCYIETYRFSEDLDFTIIPGAAVMPDALGAVFTKILGRIHDESGIDFGSRAPTFRLRPSGSDVEGKVYYRGPRGAPTDATVKLDLNAAEQLARPAVPRSIAHGYPDTLPAPATVMCYSLEELFAEKLRAMGERGRPRDLYDIINLFRREDMQADPAEIRALLTEKCAAKGVPVPTLAGIQGSPHRAELETEWASMLGHQLPQLPPFAAIWEELPALFTWLEGRAVRPRLPQVPVPEAIDATWAIPRTMAVWGVGFPIEAIRFAASNRLCVELGYGGTVRVVEPYSFRRTRAADILLYAVKSESGEVRGYRIDRIQSARVSARSFVPRFQVEIGSAGPFNAPPTARRKPGSSHRRVRR